MKRKSSFNILTISLLLIAALCYFLTQQYFSTAINRFFTNITSDKFGGDELFSVHFIDIGQGDSALISSPDGKYMLIDAGPNSGERKLYDYLKDLKVKKLEYVIFTHPHEDHIGNGDMILDKFEVKNVIMAKAETSSVSYEKLLKKLKSAKENGTRIISPSVGDRFPLGDASFTILSSKLGNENDDKDYLNNSSIVLKLDYKSVSFMFTGDAEKISEKEILKSDFDLKSTVLKVGHHGSKESTNEDFLKEVRPAYAVISCETDNTYGHPHSKTLDSLSKIRAKVYRTDLNGDIIFKTDGEYIYIKTSK